MRTFGVKTLIINFHHFRFLKGVRTADAVILLIDLIDWNRRRKRACRIILFDFKAVFDTINHELFFKIIVDDFRMKGSILVYLKLCFSTRGGKVKMQGCYSEWRAEIKGERQQQHATSG